MPADRGSWAAELPVTTARALDGTTHAVVALRLVPASATFDGAHRVVRGETVDLVARQHLGDERLWWRVLDANPVRYPLDLEPGEFVRLPAVEQVTRAKRVRSF